MRRKRNIGAALGRKPEIVAKPEVRPDVNAGRVELREHCPNCRSVWGIIRHTSKGSRTVRCQNCHTRVDELVQPATPSCSRCRGNGYVTFSDAQAMVLGMRPGRHACDCAAGLTYGDPEMQAAAAQAVEQYIQDGTPIPIPSANVVVCPMSDTPCSRPECTTHCQRSVSRNVTRPTSLSEFRRLHEQDWSAIDTGEVPTAGSSQSADIVEAPSSGIPCMLCHNPTLCGRAGCRYE